MAEESSQPRVDFYVLSEAAEGAAGQFVCRLVEKVWRAGHRVYLQAPDGSAVRELDRLLWSYRQDAFLPHEPYDPAAPEPVAPVVIGSLPDGPPGGGEVLVNLAPPFPPFFHRFQRVAEVVSAAPGEREAGRARYRRYRDAGAELHFHEL